MNPEEVFDYIERHIAEQDEVELLLLKGHLVLEQAINARLFMHMSSEKQLIDMNLMFGKKVDLLVALEGRRPIESVDVITHLRVINKIRNKLAHHLDFESHYTELEKWAKSVLGGTPKALDESEALKVVVRNAFVFLAAILSADTMLNEIEKKYISSE